MDSRTVDLIVIGGGPAGYVPAVRAAQLGASVIVFEEEDIGGTCLNRGCVPTKTMVSTVHLLRRSRKSRRLSLEGELSCDWSSLSRRKDQVVSRLRKGVEARLSALGVEVVRGHAVLVDRGVVRSGSGAEARAANVLLAPGSVPLLPGPLSTSGVLTSREVLQWEELPESLLIVGGGVIGCEFASVFSALGVDVTVVEMLPSILPGVDEDVKAVVERSLGRGGVRLIKGDGASSVSIDGGRASLVLRSGQTVTAGRVLIAVGRRPRTGDLGLDDAGVSLRGDGAIEVDDDLRTSVPGVYAAGDATGMWQLAHAGSAQALLAVDRMFGPGRRRLDPDAIPSCVFTDPEVAVVGPGEEELARRDIEFETGRAAFIANGRAVGMGETGGFLKLLVGSRDRRILGVQIVGPEASSLVGEAVLAVSAGVTVDLLAEAVHPHPTLSELFMEAAEALCEGAIHG